MRMLAKVMHAIALIQNELLAIYHLSDATLQHENQLFPLMLYSLGPIANRNVQNE